jgi:metal-dependent amidase/aminoacylase/carboxypeptidase family protein
MEDNMGNAPFDFHGQNLATDASGVSVLAAELAHIQIASTIAVAPSATSILAATALTAAVQAITAGITNPAIPRNVSIKGNASGNAGNVVIKGTNYQGYAITETIALNGTSTAVGAKAFKTITEIDLPIQTHAGTDTVSIGFGAILGLPYLLKCNTVQSAFLNNIIESTAPTVTIDSANIENNTITLNSTLNGNQVDIYLLT